MLIKGICEFIGYRIGLGILALLSAALAVTVVILCCKLTSNRYPVTTYAIHLKYYYICRYKPGQVQIQLTEERAIDSERETQLYEEIGDSGADVAAQGTAASGRRTTSAPEYEDVIMPADGKTDAYQITQCSAYGVSINN